MKRRDVLKHFGAAGALTMLGGTPAFSRQKVNKLTVRGGAIDVHHHHQPPELGVGAGGRGGRASAPSRTLSICCGRRSTGPTFP